MRKLQTVCATTALLFTLTVTSLAGEMHTPKPPPPQVNGEMPTPKTPQQVYGEMGTPQKSPATLEPLTKVALTVLQSLLTLF